MPKDSRWISLPHKGNWTLYDESDKVLHVLNWIPTRLATTTCLYYNLCSYLVQKDGVRQRLKNDYESIKVELDAEDLALRTNADLLEILYAKYEDHIFGQAEAQIFSPMALLSKGLSA